MKNIVIYPAPFFGGILLGYFLIDLEKSLRDMLESTPIGLFFIIGCVLIAAGVIKLKPLVFPGEFLMGISTGLYIRSKIIPV